ncbi:MAG: hypothetical protein PWQ31_1695 [Eubacteriales bacterium]|nr:hypothetical protein [Eubacteriales bacterium]
MGVATFVLATAFTYFSELVVAKLKSVVLSLVFLFFIVCVHVIFDTIGIAATVAEEAPFHAKRAKKIKGADKAVIIVRNADRVANWTNDVIGDITSIVGGALGASIVLRLVAANSSINSTLASMTMAGVISALMVGGKALGKKIAMDRAETIIFTVGRALSWAESFLPVRLTKKGGRRKGEGARK